MKPVAVNSGFTLIEVLAVLFLTALVIGLALDFYVDLSNQSARASEVTREIRRATTLLDRIAHDLERTVLMQRPDDTDPLEHPWLFLAEPRLAENGSDRIKFMARRAAQARGNATQGDVTTVSYVLQSRDDNGAYDLYRWSSPSVPESLDREFPAGDTPGALPLAENLSLFELRFLSEAGDWTQEWDSSQIEESNALPIAVEIKLALAQEALLDTDGFESPEPNAFSRQVMLPLRPLDLAALFDPDDDSDGDADDDEAQGLDPSLTVADCVDESRLRNLDIDIESIRAPASTSPWSEFAGLLCGLPEVKPECCT